MTKQQLSLRTLFYNEMKKREMSQTDVANLLGVSRQYINGYLMGRFNISHDHIEKLLDYFDLVKR